MSNMPINPIMSANKITSVLYIDSNLYKVRITMNER